jgi:UDPglucose 6-dehydrogenase
MNISVIGTGYVGLVSGTCLAELGHQVTCVDIDASKVNQINQGIPTIHEAGLEELLKKNIGKRLRATIDLSQAVLDTQLSIIAVGTPFDGSLIDLRYLREVAFQIGTILREKSDYHVVVVKSTVVPGTTDEVLVPILEEASGKQAGRDFGVCMNPEFLKEGEAISDFMSPDRIVVGGIDEKSIAVLTKLYEVFEGKDKQETNCKTAEMIKYTANCLLATMISFSNEMGNLCSAVGGIDVVDVMRGVHLDKRLTPILADGERIYPGFVKFIEAGCGFGGSCFPKDVKALKAFGVQKGLPMNLLESVISVNTSQYKQVTALLYKHYPSLDSVKVAVLGLAFKPETDDIRESPAIPVLEELLNGYAKIKAFDPVANDEMRKLIKNNSVEYCQTIEEAIEGVHAVLLLTRWPEFNRLPGLLKNMPDAPLVIDGRRMLDKNTIQRYEGIGLQC